MGLPYGTLPAGANQDSPISTVQGQSAGTTLIEFECLGGVTTGILLGNVRHELSITATEVRLVIPATIDESATHDLPGSGFHTVVSVFDPPNNRASVYVDGRLVIEASGAYTSWGRAGASFLWDYADGLSNVGQIRDLEVFVSNDVPAIF
jgi:hypothetical protein